MIFAVAALASSCENEKQNPGVIVDISSAEPTTATTKKPAATTAAPTTAEPTTASTAETVPTTTETAATVPTTPTTPTEPTVPTSTTAEATTVPTTTEATTAETPIVTPGVLEYDVNDPEFGTLHVKIYNVNPLPSNAIQPKLPNWEDVSRVNLRSRCNLIVKASIADMQEVCINIVGNPIYRTVLTLEIENTYHDTSYPSTSRIKVFCELSSRDTTTDAANIYIGGVYYFFLEKVESNPNNRIGYENICDYFMTLPPNEDYLIFSGARINDRMIALLNYNDNSLDIEPRDDLGYVLQSIFG